MEVVGAEGAGAGRVVGNSHFVISINYQSVIHETHRFAAEQVYNPKARGLVDMILYSKSGVLRDT